jgi:hypothetical protein
MKVYYIHRIMSTYSGQSSGHLIATLWKCNPDPNANIRAEAKYVRKEIIAKDICGPIQEGGR